MCVSVRGFTGGAWGILNRPASLPLSRLHTFARQCGVWHGGISILIASLLMRGEFRICFAWRVAGHCSLPGPLSTHMGSSISLISSGIFVACFLKFEMCDLN